MNPHTDRGTIHLNGNHALDHSIHIEKQLKIRGYNGATISSTKTSAPVFWLRNELYLTSLHFDSVNLLGLLQSTKNKTIVILMCQFTSSIINITSSQTHFSMISSNFTGGAGLMIADSTLIITDSRFESNTASHASGGNGGALYIEKSDVTISDSSCRIINSKVHSNSASNDGGGIYSYRYSSCRIINSAVYSNKATVSGGGICSHHRSKVNITKSAVNSNFADNKGGGMYSSDSLVTILSTFF